LASALSVTPGPRIERIFVAVHRLIGTEDGDD
jgi:hypothetical protein